MHACNNRCTLHSNCYISTRECPRSRWTLYLWATAITKWLLNGLFADVTRRYQLQKDVFAEKLAHKFSHPPRTAHRTVHSLPCPGDNDAPWSLRYSERSSWTIYSQTSQQLRTCRPVNMRLSCRHSSWNDKWFCCVRTMQERDYNII